jgi:tRNA modification GTPase
MVSGDTIVAISSAVGPAARIILRASGPEAIHFAEQIAAPPEIVAGHTRRVSLTVAGLSFPAWLYVFRAPRSYTGEDLVEFHIPGNPVLGRMLLKDLLDRGARAAEPGEFTARAYFNGRMDLTAAEGVAATISAGSEQELSAARRLLAGELARRVAPVMDLIAQTLARTEMGIDFSEEDVSFVHAAEVEERIGRADELLARLLSESARFERLAHEPQVVLVGRPNAGKSTLLNALAGRPRAVISPVAGTTRDALSAEVTLARGTIRLIDVAGINDSTPPGATTDAIDLQMREHAVRAVKTADLVVLVQDITDPRPTPPLPREPALVVTSKQDLQPSAPALDGDRVYVSAVTGAGMDQLRQRLDELCFGQTSAAPALALNVRHVNALSDAREALRRAREFVVGGPELLALELREALDALGGILGGLSPDDLLGRIFSSFCIGK